MSGRSRGRGVVPDHVVQDEPITGIIIQRDVRPAATRLVRHAVCHHEFLNRPVGPWRTLCGGQSSDVPGDRALPRCPGCLAAARDHGMLCDCWKRGAPGATVPLR